MKKNYFYGTEFLNEFGITKSEFMMICDELNGCMIGDIRTLKIPWLIDEITDGCYYRHLDKKWDVDKKVLCAKIRTLDEDKFSVLLKGVCDFWNVDWDLFIGLKKF